MRGLRDTASGIVVVMLGAALGLAGCQSSGGSSTSAEPPPSGTVAENTVTLTALVKAIDLGTRTVLLQRPDGTQVSFKAGPDVRNLEQVRVGDEVRATYFESIAFEVRRAGTAEPGLDVASGVARAPQGERPGAAGATVTTLTATIAGIDEAAGTVTLRGPEGAEQTIKVRHPENLKRVSVGDLVDLTYTEAVAISVETPK